MKKHDKVLVQAWARYHAQLEGTPGQADAFREYQELVEARQGAGGREPGPWRKGEAMKVKKVEGFKCPECDAYIPKEDVPEVSILYQCGECEEVFEDRDEAKECCKA
mgnify:CR=1 FL=1